MQLTRTSLRQRRKLVAKYRAVLMVPTVVEFENPGTQQHATSQVRRIASGMGKTKSEHPRQPDALYEPKVLECVVIDGEPDKTPEIPQEPLVA